MGFRCEVIQSRATSKRAVVTQTESQQIPINQAKPSTSEARLEPRSLAGARSPVQIQDRRFADAAFARRCAPRSRVGVDRKRAWLPKPWTPMPPSPALTSRRCRRRFFRAPTAVPCCSNHRGAVSRFSCDTHRGPDYHGDGGDILRADTPARLRCRRIDRVLNRTELRLARAPIGADRR